MPVPTVVRNGVRIDAYGAEKDIIPHVPIKAQAKTKNIGSQLIKVGLYLLGSYCILSWIIFANSARSIETRRAKSTEITVGESSHDSSHVLLSVMTPLATTGIFVALSIMKRL